jgi:hypothetical protein
MQKSDQTMTIHDPDHSSPSSARVKNECSHSGTPTCAFMACTSRNLLSLWWHSHTWQQFLKHTNSTCLWFKWWWFLGVSNQAVQTCSETSEEYIASIFSIIVPGSTGHGSNWNEEMCQFHRKVEQTLTNALSSPHIHSCICPSAGTANGHSWSSELHLAQFKPSPPLSELPSPSTHLTNSFIPLNFSIYTEHIESP